MIRLLLVLFGGAIAWSLHLVLSYLVLGLVCRPGRPLLEMSPEMLVLLLLAISVAAAAGAAVSALLAIRLWRRSADDPSEASRSSRISALAFVGLLLNLIFLVTIIVGASAPFFVPPC